jgi:hypothetical protein
MTVILSDQIATWKYATEQLPAGVQHAISDALKLCAEGKIRLAYGANVHEGVPCLMNSVSNMTTQQDSQSPSAYAGEVVYSFDAIAAAIGKRIGKNSNFLHPVAAEFLLKHFGDLKPIIVTEIPADFAECEGFTVDDENCLNSWVANSIRGLDDAADVVEQAFSDGTSQV